MALVGADRAYLPARSGLARSGAIRSAYVGGLVGVVTVNGQDVTGLVRYGSLRVNQAINEEPDRCTFDAYLVDAAIDAALTVGAAVVIGQGGPTANALFGGRIVSTSTRYAAGGVPALRSVLCADYLQVLDAELLITYTYPAQSATTTILDLCKRFANKPGSQPIGTAYVAAGLPAHAALAIVNERWSTVLRRLVTTFPTGGGFYVDPLAGLHVWTGASEPGVINPAPLTLALATLKQFAAVVDGAQQRDAVLVEGQRTSAPIGAPGVNLAFDSTGRSTRSLPVGDASLFVVGVDATADKLVRIGSQRLKLTVADGAWSSPAGTPQTATATADVAYNPDPSVQANEVTLPIDNPAILTGRVYPWILTGDQYLQVLRVQPTPAAFILPRTGFGAPIGPIKNGATVTAHDSIGALTTTGRYDAPGGAADLEAVRPQPVDADVVVCGLAVASSGATHHEHLVQDGRYSHAGCVARARQELADFQTALRAIDFETDDLHAAPGRMQDYNVADEAGRALTSGSSMIVAVELTWPTWDRPPRRACHAATVAPANVVDTWTSETR